MSLYQHKRTGVLYTKLFTAFNVETQDHHSIYVNDKGEIFSRNSIKFAENFTLIEANPQSKITPKEPHE